MSNGNDDFDAIKASMILNIKRAVTPMLILRMIAASDTTVMEAQETIANASNGMLVIENLYSSVNRFLARGYVENLGPRDSHLVGRHADIFRITQKGMEALMEYERLYGTCTQSVDNVILMLQQSIADH